MTKRLQNTKALAQFNDAVKAYGVRGLASLLSVTPAYVSMIANGKRPLTPALLTRFSGLVNTHSVNSSFRGMRHVKQNKSAEAQIRTGDTWIFSPLLYP